MKFVFNSLLLFFVLSCSELRSHPMPNSVLLLDIKANGISAELQWPLNELQLALPGEDIERNPNTLLIRKGAWLENYLRSHMLITDLQGRAWKVLIKGEELSETEQIATGPFREVVFKLWLQPPAGISPRHFIMNYNAIMHQVVTHKMLIRIRQDWDGGLSAKDSSDADLGLLMMSTSNNKVPPLIINLDEGSKWKGFKSMVSLGIEHIAEGTDHLLFLLVLMLPAPLRAFGKKWTTSIGTRAGGIRLLKIATAFTVGHSITLLAGAVGWLKLPSQPVEIIISLSIFISAIHALRPIFPDKEVFVAAGFGLVHGLAFAATLSDLDLDGARMALSILGFNIGIELMQIFVILMIVPWFIVLSSYSIYRWIRISGAIFALVASLAWMVERGSQKSNWVTFLIQQIAGKGQWIVLFLAIISLVTYFVSGKKTNATK